MRRRLPWHLTVRPDERALLTLAGIALCAAFATVSFGIPEGLEGAVISSEGHLARPYRVAESGADGTTVSLFLARLEDGRELTLAVLDGPDAPVLEPGSAILPDWLGASRSVELAEPRISLTRVPSDPSSNATRITSGVWAIVAKGTVPTDREADHRYVIGRDIEGIEAPAAAAFFRNSAREVARDLFLIVVFSGVIVGLFAYEFLRAEVHARRGEIALWRAIGMAARDVGALLLGRAAAIAALGGLCGVTIGVGILAIGGRAVGSAVVSTIPTAATLAAILCVCMLSAIAGAAVPAIRVTRGAVAEDLGETA